MPAIPSQIDPEVLTRFAALREAAVCYAVAASETSDPEIHARFGVRGRAACAEDIAYHLDFLRPALETGDVTPFVGYLAWLVQVLKSRGVPHQSVLRSVGDLARFFQDQLGESGMPIVAALRAGEAALLKEVAAPAFDRPCPDRWDEAGPYSAAALRGERTDATAVLDGALARRDSLALVAVHVIQPAMYEIGRLWQQNTVSVAREQFATALSQSWMARTMAQAKPAPGNGKRALFGCLAENRHVMGIRMVADAFELDGWTTYDLEAPATPMSVIGRIRETRPHLVGFSASLPRHLRGLREAIGVLREVLGDECPRIVVGGLVFNQFPHLAGWVGAEVLGADAVSAAAAALSPAVAA